MTGTTSARTVGVESAADSASPPWRSLVDVCATDAGPFDPSLLAAWRGELDDVQRRVAVLAGAGLVDAGPRDALPLGVHALLALAGARLGSLWRVGQLIDAAAAVELARRAVSQHEAVRDREHARVANREHVLRGDWSITQAARLTAEIGPAAYRVLVRGWGGAQLLQLRTGRAPARDVLFDTAISLGALTAGIPADALFRGAEALRAVTQVRDWAGRL
jgi:hypothetical protein